MAFHEGAWLHHGMFSNDGVGAYHDACRDNDAIANSRAAIDNGTYPDGDIVADLDPRIRQLLPDDEMGTENRLVPYRCVLGDDQEGKIKENPSRVGISA